MPKHILIVDDDPDIVELMKDILLMEGYEVSFAHSGEEGLERLKNVQPDLILLDIMMPAGMDGWETLEAIRSNKAYDDVPVVMVTAKQPTFRIAQTKAKLIDGYLVKPFTPAALIQMVSDVFSMQQDLNEYIAKAEKAGVDKALIEEYAKLYEETKSHRGLWTLLKQVYPERKLEENISYKNTMHSMERYMDAQRKRLDEVRTRIREAMGEEM